ncbi:MAG: MerR family transcriptional regulator [Rhodospirillaceae bacterium]
MTAPADTSDGGATRKSASAFRTISEVSKELGLPQHVLRFWESKFSRIKPMKRGGGRRYYRPEDLDLLRRIRDLLYEEGYTIKGVQKLLKESGGKLADPEPARAASAGEGGLDSSKIEALKGVLTELEDISRLL